MVRSKFPADLNTAGQSKLRFNIVSSHQRSEGDRAGYELHTVSEYLLSRAMNVESGRKRTVSAKQPISFRVPEMGINLITFGILIVPCVSRI